MKLRSLPAFARYLLAAAAVVALGIVLLPLRSLLPSTAVMLLFVPAIVGISLVSDVRASAVAAIIAFLTLDFLFTPPFYQFNVQPIASWLGLLAFLVVALVTARQTSSAREREQLAVSRQRELQVLNIATFRAASEKSAVSLAEFVVGQVADALSSPRTALYDVGPDRSPRLLAERGRASDARAEWEMAAWVLREAKAVGVPAAGVPVDQRPVIAETRPTLAYAAPEGAYLPLETSDGIEGILVAVPLHPDPVTPDEARFLAALSNISATCLERLRLEGEATHAEAAREAERLKDTLVSSVSHELKTPLTAATARVSSLLERDGLADERRVRSQLEAVAHDLGRLDVSIGDLLDVSRLESASWRPRLERFDVREILGTVLSRLPAELHARVVFDIADLIPEVLVDGVQVARALTNLVENAFAYSPADTPVMIDAGMTRDGQVEVAVEDRGPGVAESEKARLFEKFYRGSAGVRAPTGSGLGLTIAAEIVRSNGGSIRVEDATPNGARFVVVLPPAPSGRAK